MLKNLVIFHVSYTKYLASFPDLPRFYLPFAFTIISGSGVLIFIDLPIPCIIVNANRTSKWGRTGTEATKYCHFIISLCSCFISELGMSEESVHILEEALETTIRLYGKDSEEEADVLITLGVTYFRMNHLQKSRFASLSLQGMPE